MMSANDDLRAFLNSLLGKTLRDEDWFHVRRTLRCLTQNKKIATDTSNRLLFLKGDGACSWLEAVGQIVKGCKKNTVATTCRQLVGG